MYKEAVGSDPGNAESEEALLRLTLLLTFVKVIELQLQSYGKV